MGSTDGDGEESVELRDDKLLQCVAPDRHPKGHVALRNLHLGEQAIVLGNGPSVKDISPKILRKHITIGVNEICRYFDPDYVVFADGPGDFATVDPSLSAVRRAFRNCEVIRMAYPTWIAFEPEIKGLAESTIIAGFTSNRMASTVSPIDTHTQGARADLPSRPLSMYWKWCLCSGMSL